MFPQRFFPQRFFPQRFWPKTGDEPVVIDSVIGGHSAATGVSYAGSRATGVNYSGSRATGVVPE